MTRINAKNQIRIFSYPRHPRHRRFSFYFAGGVGAVVSVIPVVNPISADFRRFSAALYCMTMVIVPHQKLQPETLRRVIEEFVTRHGAVHGHGDESIERSIEQVISQLNSGEAVLAFDEEDESCTIASKNNLPDAGR